MRRAFQVGARPRADSHALAVVVLGANHPLVHASDLLPVIIRQCIAVAAVLLGAILARTQGQGWAWLLVIGAGIMLSILTLLAAGFQHCKRDQAIKLILSGYQNVPIEAIQAQRSRLVSARRRETLARRFERIAEQASNGSTWRARASVPLLEPGPITDTTDDLLALAQALNTAAVTAQGVARAERLISDTASPFYGEDAIAFRAELRRIRYDLVAA
jgi:hypothetical protein